MDAKYQDVKFLAGPEHLRNVNDYFHYGPCTTTVDPRRFRGRQVPRRDPEELRNVYHYRRRVPLRPSSTTRCTTTVAEDRKCTTTAAVDSTRQRVPLLPRRPVNAYFLYTAPNSNRSKNTRFEGITRDDRDEMPLHV